MASGDRATAVRWLERAHRLAPSDSGIRLSLAAACLGADNARAAALFGQVAARNDLREAWIGLAGARRGQADHVGAADAFATALRRYSVTDGANAMGDVLARDSGAAGWCGLLGDGVPVVCPHTPGDLELRLDGHRIGNKALPQRWPMARALSVTVDGRHLLGSPIDLAAIARLSGCVESWEGGIRGWAWHPGDPETDPALTIRGEGNRPVVRIVANDETISFAHNGALTRPRGFRIHADDLAGMTGLIRVLGRDGRTMLGSPLDPGAEQRATAAAARELTRLYPVGQIRGRGPRGDAPPAAMQADVVGPLPPEVLKQRRRPVDVVIPVHGRMATVMACLDTVIASVRSPSRIVVVDDASPEADLSEALVSLAHAGGIRLLRHASARGFPASANAGIAACAGRDVVLLNSDTLVPPGWLERLGDAAWSAPDIGTVTPLSNNASIMTYPDPAKIGPAPDRTATEAMDRLAHRANGGRANGGDVTDLPVGVGFCIYIKRACLDAVGGLRADVFAQGYGEENDFCLRARHLGWRHVGLTSLFVAHLGSESFGTEGYALKLRNEKILNRIHPGYAALIAAFLKIDPLAASRRRLDLERWRKPASRRQESVILITHGHGGGVEQRVITATIAHRAAGFRVVTLRPAADAGGQMGVVVGDGPDGGFPNLRYAQPTEIAALLRLLRATHPAHIEVHHLLGHSPSIYELVARIGVPYDVHVHDYASFCPRISLVGGGGRYCGEPDVRGCEVCVADNGRLINEIIGIQDLRDRSAGFLAKARHVVAPSRDAAARMRRQFPDIDVVTRPHDVDAALPAPTPPRIRDGVCRVCVAGAIGQHKGYDILLACARDAAARALHLEFVVVGDTIDDDRLFATGCVFVTGTYDAAEAVPLIRAQGASLGFLPSIWPETWALTLTELWGAGLFVAAFDFGAPAERIRETGRGFVLPLGLSPVAINNALLAAAGRSGHE